MKESTTALMVENRPVADFIAHAILILGVIVVAFPLWVTFVASTRTFDEIVNVPMPLTPGTHLLDNYTQALSHGSAKGSAAQSVVLMAIVIALTVIQFRFVERKVQY